MPTLTQELEALEALARKDRLLAPLCEAHSVLLLKLFDCALSSDIHSSPLSGTVPWLQAYLASLRNLTELNSRRSDGKQIPEDKT